MMFSLFRKGKKPAEPAPPDPAVSKSAAPAPAAAGLSATPSTSGGRMLKVSMTVNGKPVSADIDARTLLVQFLRENLRLTGTHVGCDTSQCGACVVHLDGRAIKSCTMLAASCDGAKIVSIEGLAQGGKLHPMQEAFREHHGLQCGFCTPGMILAAVDIVQRRGAALSEEVVRADLEGNICRCTGYHNIVAAVMAGAASMAASGAGKPQAAE
jgi:aerobic carbon-monoxide dehydrogenase small subunit